jgi:uncharacterized coiled-coil protein SlyX
MKTIDELREELARQVLEIALETDNPQLKLDALARTAERGKTAAAKPAVNPPPGSNGMAAFAARVKRAEERGSQDAGEPDEPSPSDQ